MSVVSQDTVKQVARLARLKLEGEQLSHIASQLDAILGYVQQLSAVPTDSVEATSHVLPLRDVLRPDENQPSLPAGEVIVLAPASRPPFVAVPKVIEGEK